MNTPTIVVTGATGNIGRPLVAALLAGGARVRALTRDPATAGLPPDVAVAGGDYAAPGILADAVRGADAVFLNIGALRQHVGELIAAARGAGVSKIVMLSSIAVRDQGDQVLSLGRQHKAVEDAVKAAGAGWTILRCGGFATNTLAWAASVRAEGVVRFPYGRAALALIAEQDIAAAAARVLLDPGHAGQTYVLTGAESLTQTQQAEAIGTATGRPVRFEELSPGQFRQSATPHFPAPVVEDLLTALASYVGQTADGIPADAPLHTLLLAASRLMATFFAGTLVQAGLRISPAGLGVLRVLLAGDGLKSSDVAARGWSSPGTLTSVVNTLVREGYVERRRDPGDRRVVRLYVTERGRRICADYLMLAGPHWRTAFDFVSPADEPVVRKFFIDTIGQFSELTRKERGR